MNGRLLGVLACLLVLPWSAPVAQCSRGTVTGEITYVRDGDTIELGEMAIRLQGSRRRSGTNPVAIDAQLRDVHRDLGLARELQRAALEAEAEAADLRAELARLESEGLAMARKLVPVVLALQTVRQRAALVDRRLNPMALAATPPPS